MELPRNITQVGETDRNCKIYVEDYVVSYMKQMNKFAEDKEISVALYGKMSEEQQITYCFVYGACAIQSVSREVRHLSQAQNQEIERLRKKYFPEQDFLGYQILNGEMIEGFRIYDQNSCRYVKGYACFFEKNDAMLAYMLETRQEEAQPEVVEQDKYDMVRKRQEDRKIQFEDRMQSRKRLSADEKSEARKSQKAENRRIEKAEGRRSEKPEVGRYENVEKWRSEGNAAGRQEEAGREENRENYRFRVAPFVLLAGCCLVAMTVWGNDITLETVKGQLSAWVTGLAESKLVEGDDKGPDNLIAEVLGQEVVIADGTGEQNTGTDSSGQEDTVTDSTNAENANVTGTDQENTGTTGTGQAVQAGTSTLVTEDKLAEAILKENEKATSETATQSETASTSETVTHPESNSTAGSAAQQGTSASQQQTASQGTTAGPETGSSQGTTVTAEAGASQGTTAGSETGTSQGTTATSETGTLQGTTATSEMGTSQGTTANLETGNPQETTAAPETTVTQETVSQPEMYVIRQGDTLIAISKSRYGNDTFVSAICALNNISNPDNIQIGQKILLP